MLVRKYLMALALLPALFTPGQSQAEALYTINVLPADFFPSDINNAGQMAGTIAASDGFAHAAMFKGGVITDLGTFSGTSSFTGGINEAGNVFGNFYTNNGTGGTFVYTNGNVLEIAGLYASDMNVHGDIAGFSNGSAVLYSQGTLTQLGYLGTGDFSTASAVNDAGDIVGTSTIDLDFHSRQHPFLYSGGVLHDLGTLDEREFNNAVAINSAGQIAGYSEGVGGGMHAFFYEHGVMSDLGSFGGLNLDVADMNEHGEIVGRGNTWDGPDVVFLSRNGVLVGLNSLIDQASGWEMSDAVAINDLGQIIGTACRDGSCSNVRLDLASPVPEPGGAVLLAAGLLAFLGRRHWRSWQSAESRRRLPRARRANTLSVRPGMLLRRLLIASVTLPAVLLSLPSYAEPLYNVSLLSENFTPADINNTGQIAGWFTTGDGQTHIALYAGGVVNDLGTMGGTFALANAINDAGAMTGFFFNSNGEAHAYVYSNGSITDLGANSEGRAINARGDVVGARWNNDGVSAFLYSDGTLTELGHLGTGNIATAWDINDNGEIVGEANTVPGSDAPRHPVLYVNGAPFDLGTSPELVRKSADAINNAGRIAGSSVDSDGVTRAFVYENGVTTDLGNFGGANLSIGGINQQGAFVGLGQKPDESGLGFIYLDGALVDLNTLIDPALGWQVA